MEKWENYMNEEIDFIMETINVLSALLTPAIAVAVAYVACHQWRTNRNRLKFELYDKRYDAYQAVRDLLEHIMVEATIKDERLVESFVRACRESEFLFDDAVGNYLQDTKDKMVKWRLNQNRSQLPAGERRDEFVKIENELLGWLIEQLPVVHDKIKPFLKLRA